MSLQTMDALDRKSITELASALQWLRFEAKTSDAAFWTPQLGAQRRRTCAAIAAGTALREALGGRRITTDAAGPGTSQGRVACRTLCDLGLTAAHLIARAPALAAANIADPRDSL